MKRLFSYFGWTIIIGFIIYLGAKYQIRVEQEAAATLEVIPVVMFSSIFSIVIGMLLRLPKLIKEIKLNKYWAFDWIKFIAIGLPSLCVSLIYVSKYHLPESIVQFIPQAIFLGNTTIQITAGVVFGYILLGSLKK